MHGGWLAAILQLLGMGGGPPAAVVVPPGGTFRRPRWAWSRTHARPAASWSRVWRYTAVPQLPAQALYPVEGDDRDYLFDLSSCPEVAAGATISSAVVVGGSGLTVGTPAATSTVQDGIAAGEAVQVRVSGWAAGTTYTLAARVTLSTGRVVTVPGRAVAADDF